MICVGIDPGKHGALVALDHERKVVAAFRAEDYTTKSEYRIAEMARILRMILSTMIVIERQHPMPKQGLTSTGSIMRAFGLWEGLAAMLGTPVVVVSASVWQKEVLRGIPGDGKERAILCAEARIPSLELKPGKCKKVHDGLADAACIALWGLAAWSRQEDKK